MDGEGGDGEGGESEGRDDCNCEGRGDGEDDGEEEDDGEGRGCGGGEGAGDGVGDIKGGESFEQGCSGTAVRPVPRGLDKTHPCSNDSPPLMSVAR